ncbi:MAG: hypothetical protein LBT53_02740 [Puniceicoccales bacterium]|jgi:hypothetical protein|nr:hypothetical protein [Puniceicoccales bacterium]
MKNSLIKVFTTLVLSALTTASLGAAMTDGRVHVGKVRGQVDIVDAAGERRALRKNETLRTVDRLQFVTGDKEKTDVSLWCQNGLRFVVEKATDFSLVSFQISASPALAQKDFHTVAAEPTHSKINTWLAFGRVLAEVRNLKMPLSEIKVTTPYIVLRVTQVPPPAPPAIYSSFVVEQGDDYAKVSCLKGAVSVVPQYKDLGKEVLIRAGDVVTFRRWTNQKNERAQFSDYQRLLTSDNVVEISEQPIAIVPFNPENRHDRNDQGSTTDSKIDDEEGLDPSLMLPLPSVVQPASTSLYGGY